jgi:hypothetical protein
MTALLSVASPDSGKLATLRVVTSCEQDRIASRLLVSRSVGHDAVLG